MPFEAFALLAAFDADRTFAVVLIEDLAVQAVEAFVGVDVAFRMNGIF